MYALWAVVTLLRRPGCRYPHVLIVNERKRGKRLGVKGFHLVARMQVGGIMIIHTEETIRGIHNF